MELTVEVLEMVASLLVGLVLPWVAQYLNNQWNLDGPKALSLVSGLSILVSLVVLFLSGTLTATSFSLDNFVPVLTVIFSTSQVFFQAFKSELGWEK